MLKYLIIVAVITAACLAQDYDEYRPAARPSANQLRYNSNVEEPKTTPVPILKQINRHNEDGSYTYGYEGGDGSFKIETKSASGEVMGKYGFIDANGKQRVIEYGANKFGFQPSGEGITVPPPTLHVEREVDYEDVPQQQYAARPKQTVKVSRPPSPPVNYARPAPVEQKQYQQPNAQTPQYYDYDEEIPTTQRPISQPARPKYSASPVPQRPKPQQFNSLDIVYADQRPAQFSQPRFDERRPPQFPSDSPPSQAQPSRSDQFSLFSPEPKIETFKPQPQYAQQEPLQYSPAPQTPRPAFASRPQQSRGTSVLDQLAKDYALPQGSSPALHDISFGYSL